MGISSSSSSSSSSGKSSSSSLIAGTVWCLYSGGCVSIAAESCSAIGGQTVQNCPVASSSSGKASSSSVASSSSSSSLSSSSSAGLAACSGGTVQIGDQVWQKCNENAVPSTGNSWCYYNNPANCAMLGRLYDWATAMALPSDCNSTSCSSQISAKHQGICPSGFHVPSNEDWSTLLDYVHVRSGSPEGTELKARNDWHYCGPSGSGNQYLCEDTYGFSALPGGYYRGEGIFNNASFYGYWWVASEKNLLYDGNDGRNANHAGLRYMYYLNGNVRWDYDEKSLGYSVRCLQD